MTPTLPMGIALRMVEAFNENHDDKTGEFYRSGDGVAVEVEVAAVALKAGARRARLKMAIQKARSSSLKPRGILLTLYYRC